MERLNLDKFKILAAAATLAMFAGTACAETELFAQLNRGLSHFDDKREAGTLFIDNAFSPSTFGVKSMAHVNKCVTVGGVAELQLSVDNSRVINQIRATDIGSNFVTVRRADTWVSGGMWGKLSLGYGDAASHGVARMSYSKTGDTVSSFRVADLAGGMVFHPKGVSATTNSGGANNTNNANVNTAFMDLDGVGGFDSVTGKYRQKNRVRWDSEKWNGFTLGVSYGNVQEEDRLVSLVAVSTNFIANPEDFDSVNARTFTDAALRYEGCFDDFLLSAGLGWARYSRDGRQVEDFINDTRIQTGTNLGTLRPETVFAGSVAAEYKPMGINAAVSYGQKRQFASALHNVKNWYVQVGKHFDWMHHGKTHIVLDYFKGKNNMVNSDASKSYSIGAVQDLEKTNASVYATLRGYQYRNGVNLNLDLTPYDKMWVGTVGFMFKFGAML